MIFKSQIRRQAVANWMLRFVAPIIVAAAASWFMDGGIVGFGIAIVALVALDIIYWILNSITYWIYWSLSGRKLAKQHILNYLVENRYPKPRAYESSPLDYFVRTMEDSELDPQLRIKAAIEVGTFAAYSGTMQWRVLMQLTRAAEAAIQAYVSRAIAFPSRPEQLETK